MTTSVQGVVLKRCSLQCRRIGHYHCPICEKTIIRRVDIEKHIASTCEGITPRPPSSRITPSPPSSSPTPRPPSSTTPQPDSSSTTPQPDSSSTTPQPDSSSTTPQPDSSSTTPRPPSSTTPLQQIDHAYACPSDKANAKEGPSSLPSTSTHTQPSQFTDPPSKPVLPSIHFAKFPHSDTPPVAPSQIFPVLFFEALRSHPQPTSSQSAPTFSLSSITPSTLSSLPTLSSFSASSWHLTEATGRKRVRSEPDDSTMWSKQQKSQEQPETETDECTRFGQTVEKLLKRMPIHQRPKAMVEILQLLNKHILADH